MTVKETLKHKLKPGLVYRRADLEQWSSSVDRHLKELVEEKVLEKVGPGMYYVPKKTVFGDAPASDEELVEGFLKDNHFVIISMNDYNTLGVGTTQLYNSKRVYNNKRHGRFNLGGKIFQFIRRPNVPSKVTKEFLLVDLVNNLDELAEDTNLVKERVRQKVSDMDRKRLKQWANKWGKVRTTRLFNEVLKHG